MPPGPGRIGPLERATRCSASVEVTRRRVEDIAGRRVEPVQLEVLGQTDGLCLGLVGAQQHPAARLASPARPALGRGQPRPPRGAGSPPRRSAAQRPIGTRLPGQLHSRCKRSSSSASAPGRTTVSVGHEDLLGTTVELRAAGIDGRQAGTDTTLGCDQVLQPFLAARERGPSTDVLRDAVTRACSPGTAADVERQRVVPSRPLGLRDSRRPPTGTRSTSEGRADPGRPRGRPHCLRQPGAVVPTARPRRRRPPPRPGRRRRSPSTSASRASAMVRLRVGAGPSVRRGRAPSRWTAAAGRTRPRGARRAGRGPTVGSDLLVPADMGDLRQRVSRANWPRQRSA